MKKLSEEIIQDNGYRCLYSCDYELKNGEQRNFLIYANTHIDAVGVIARTREGKYLCIDEYRVGPEKIVRGMILGGHEHGYSHLESAQRELAEEGGGTSNEWYVLGQNIMTTYTKGYIYYFFADNVELGSQYLEEGEEITRLFLTQEEIESSIANGTIECPYNIAMYHLVQHHIKNSEKKITPAENLTRKKNELL